MVKTLIGGIDVAPYILEYRIENPPVYGGNSFTDIGGAEVQDKLGDKVILHLSMADIPHAVAEQIAAALQADSISVSYTTPVPAAGVFKKTSYNAVCCDADPDETDTSVTDDVKWEIDVTLESTVYAASSGGGL